MSLNSSEIGHSPDQTRKDYSECTRDLIGVVDDIVQEAHLLQGKDAEKTGATLSWMVHGDNSHTAQTLQEVIQTGNPVGKSRGVGLDFNSLTEEPNLRKKYGNDYVGVKVGLVIDIAKRLGFFDDEATKKDIEMNGYKAKTYHHPQKPLDITLNRNGADIILNRRSTPRVMSFDITHR